MPKPSATMDDGIRFRGSLPASGNGGLQPRNAPPPAPAPVETRREKPARPAASAKPVIAPEATRAQAEPEPVRQGSAGAGAGRQGRAGCCPCPRARHPSRRRSDARARHPPRRRSSARARHSPRRRACSRCCNCARARDPPGRRCCRAERRERGRCRQQASRDRHQQAVRPRDRAQARARCNRRALPEGPQLPAAVGVAGRAQRARPGRDRTICARSTPTASIRRTIRCRGSTSAARRRRPKPS